VFNIASTTQRVLNISAVGIIHQAARPPQLAGEAHTLVGKGNFSTKPRKKPFWVARPETAISRVRGRIENVLSSAKARGLRTGRTPRNGAVT